MVFDGQRILVTGGTGSFGQAFIAWLLKQPVKKVIVFSRDEQKQFAMRRSINDGRMRYWIGCIRDAQRVRHVMQQADIVIHAAAYKIVDSMEYNPEEAAKTNVLGTQNVIDAVVDSPVRRAVLLSTDKAVSPENLYGATKKVAEALWIGANVHKLVFSFVRYGNVMESRGGVLSIWREKIAQGLPLDLTDERMTRFWLSYPMAIAAVEEACSTQPGIGVVWKAPGFKLTALLAALAPEGFVFRFTGIGAGEKLHESLVSEGEVPRTYDAGKCFHIRPARVFDESLAYPSLPRVPEGFRYTSDQTRLTVEEIQRLCSSS